MNRGKPRISDYILERYLLGELPQEEWEAIRREVDRDESLRARLAALEQSDRELREQYPPAWMARRIRLKLEGPAVAGQRRIPSWRLWLAPAALVALLLAALPLLVGQEGGTGHSGIRIKGMEPHLKLFRKTVTGSEMLTDGSLAREGDIIQIAYHAAGEPYGAILSADGRGTTTQHLPAEDLHAVALRQGGADTLGFSYALDDAPRWERFYFVTADIPFDVSLVRKAIRLAADAGGQELALPKGFKLHVFTLIKAGENE